MIVLAHEIGHHIFFHTVLSGASDLASSYMKYGVSGSPDYDPSKFQTEEGKYWELRRRQELEADRFAGFILAKRKVPFEQVARFYTKLSKYYVGSADSAHPAIDARIDALKEGYALLASTPKGQPVDLSGIGKEKLNLVFTNVTRLERDNLLKKIITNSIDTAARLFTNGKYKMQYFTGVSYIDVLDSPQIRSLIAYLGRSFKKYTPVLDDENDFLSIEDGMFSMIAMQRNMWHYRFGFHIRGGYFYLLLFDNDEVKVAYKSRFEDRQISYAELKLLFTRIFRNETQKIFDDYTK
jgi:hypothetical protein